MACNTAIKTALVTGANKGIGFQVAHSLAMRNYRVIMADKVNQRNSKQKIMNSTCNNNVTTEYLDLASFNSIKDFVEKIRCSEKTLDILVNNAGVFCMKKRQTEDCLDGVMQTNYLGPFLLTHLLLTLMKATPKSRIIFVTSSGSFFHNMSVDKLKKPDYFPPHFISGAIHYYNTKLCTMIASKLLAEKLKCSQVTANSVHPGMTKTDFMVANANIVEKTLAKPVLNCTRSVKNAADSVVFLATSGTVSKLSGKYFVDYQVKKEPRVLEDKKFCDNIWNESLRLVNFCAEA